MSRGPRRAPFARESTHWRRLSAPCAELLAVIWKAFAAFQPADFLKEAPLAIPFAGTRGRSKVSFGCGSSFRHLPPTTRDPTTVAQTRNDLAFCPTRQSSIADRKSTRLNSSHQKISY